MRIFDSERNMKIVSDRKEKSTPPNLDYLEPALPVTVASVERSFSKIKLVKNILRTTMEDGRTFTVIVNMLNGNISSSLKN